MEKFKKILTGVLFLGLLVSYAQAEEVTLHLGEAEHGLLFVAKDEKTCYVTISHGHLSPTIAIRRGKSISYVDGVVLKEFFSATCNGDTITITDDKK